MKICVLGLGYIGLPTALLFAAHGANVVGVDVKQSVVDCLNHGNLPFNEPGIESLYHEAKVRFRARTEPEAADVFLIAVPTPLDPATKVSDLSYVKKAAEMIAPHLAEKNLVVLESTVPPGTSERVVIPRLEKSGVAAGEFLYAHCPERAIPGRTLQEMTGNSRVIGGYDRDSIDRATAVYQTFVRGQIYQTDTRTAEFVKLMENTCRDVNIALANEFAQLAEECGINVWEAITLANKHPRVSILKPGPGVGGHCIAIDPWFLTENSTRCRMVATAREVNDSMPNYVLHIARSLLAGIRNPTICIFGVAYKGNIGDTRESPAFKFIQLAENEGYAVRCYDPYVGEFPHLLIDAADAAAGSDCLVVLTDHDCFRAIDPAGLRMRTKHVIDARNILDHEKWVGQGFSVRVLGDGSLLQPVPLGEVMPPAGLYSADATRSIAPPSPPSISLLSPNGREGYI
ncbi:MULTISPECIES: nucleotide sugar dehydrogenase [unclassified Methanoculleus]|uniref:nucleotide sugar dehydrogenase n=1 Tax=unclassified Methanoculleus TaxID=2619537 RepID=UPI0025F6401A|nr:MULTISPECIES: nucleotide sugar dehydrogenase [unclassified Methanoculleus]MCK9316769.1 nucleotide sugar dehydrogenase [Methanoculleus sp.]MDD2252770.1 nucleotide sugar dehydrogenase [Methanoculleus sp.]MDD2786493.1 nucleotide sugar dehydrogenase [Methanoculleus sp.]MDD3215247.1 nucleotide sugar dehydrogenase [Methanoculleus sp.]MDD4313013.1 nucleotide sugar dehydrogenase [Methanoculleus sp.]